MLDPADMGFDPRDVLFVGLGRSNVAWYRCYTPAMFMGADYIGLEGDDVKSKRLTVGARRRESLIDYKVIVFEQPRGDHAQLVRELRAAGIKVLYEIDDYVHAIRKMDEHGFKEGFTKKKLRGMEQVMQASDALIVSTDYIAQRYRKFNPNVHVCEIGLDLARYNLTRPPRPTVNVGWAGGTGHEKAAQSWISQVYDVMCERENVAFVSVGLPFARAFAKNFGTRAVAVPFTMLDTYPAAMCMFDIALAPAGPNSFFRGKSDLRFLEAGALGIPCIGDPGVYPSIEHGVTGFHAETPEQCRELLEQLVDDPSLRLEVGANAREYVWRERSMKVAVHQWIEAIASVLDGG